MISARTRIAATVVMAVIGLSATASAVAQEKPKDEGLEKLLEKLEAKDKSDAAKDKPESKPPGEVAPKDQELDKLLEGLGQTKDKPTPDDKKPGEPSNSNDKPSKPDDLKGGEVDLDQELERITGKKPKQKNPRPRNAEEETGPLGEVIKEMRNVEERLGKPDTGSETRKKQTEIVKNLESLIEKMKSAPSQSMAMKMMREGQKPGQPKPSGQPGDQPGARADGAPPSKPADPRKNSIVAIDKSIWGQLPAQFRDGMSNVDNEHPLPARFDLIRQYYLSLGKKTSTPEE